MEEWRVFGDVGRLVARGESTGRLIIGTSKASIDDCQGILVTRHGYGELTVALNEAVPYGETEELVA